MSAISQNEGQPLQAEASTLCMKLSPQPSSSVAKFHETNTPSSEVSERKVFVDASSLWSEQQTVGPPEPKDQKTSSIAMDQSSLTDSAYASMSGCDASITTVSTTPSTVVGKLMGRPIPGTKLQLFKRGGTEEDLKHYETVRSVIQEWLVQTVRAKGHEPYGSVIMRLGIIGESEDDARYWVVAFGKPALADTVRNFFESDEVTSLLRSDNVEKLPFLFFPRCPNLPSVLLDINVCRKGTLFPGDSTHCGAAIVFESLASSEKGRQMSTFGGMIKVNYVHGRSELFGMTAGHAVKKLQLEDGMSAEVISPEKLEVSETDLSSHHSHVIGRIVDTNALPGVSAGRTKPSNDWSLFVVNEPRINLATTPSSTKDLETTAIMDTLQGIHVAEQPTFLDGASDPVLLLGGAGGPRRGELSSLPAAIWIEGSDGFVDAYPLELTESVGKCSTEV